MPRLLLLLPTTTYRAEAFLEAARRMQVSVTIGMERIPEDLPVASEGVLLLDIRHPQAAAQTVAEFARQHPINAVIGVDDVTAVTAAAIAEALGLPHNSVDSVTAAGNKRRCGSYCPDRAFLFPAIKCFPWTVIRGLSRN